MTNLVDRLPLSLRARFSRGSTTRRSGDASTSAGNRSGGSLSRGYWGGLTLIEMLVALAITLVMMAAVVNLFANMSESIRNRRAAIETGSQLRQVRNRLAMDLSGATCRGSTWQDPAENQGYIEIIEGEWTDKNPTGLNIAVGGEIDPTTSLIPSSQAIDTSTGAMTDARALGDWDDVLALTTQSESAPFTGKIPFFNNVTNTWEQRFDESHQAEVIWFAEENGPGGANGEPGMRRIYRRALLINPNISFPPLSTISGTTPVEKLREFYRNYDVSVRIEDGRIVGNTLGDLTKRENRFYHNNNTFNPGSTTNGFPHVMLSLPNGNADALVLNNALAFDIRLFDATAPLIENAGVVVGPCDAGFDAGLLGTTVGQGDYVDMNYRSSYAKFINDFGLTTYGNFPTGTSSVFSELASVRSQLQTPLGSIFDTWSYHYENDGIDQDNNGVIDQGANGLDDDNANGVDDRGERETSPPYDVPLRGVKVILRVYEPDSRQIRESSVTHSFKQ